MNLKQLARVDLNLLVTLHVLLEQQSASLAAEKLHLTQPAISKALDRLRSQFDDPLFQRVSKGLVPTPYARSLQQPLQDWLTTATNLFVQETFNPATAQMKFSLVANDFLHMIVVPKLIALLARTAPGIVLKTHTQYHNQLQGLEQGELDFVLNLEFTELSTAFVSDLVYTDKPTLFARVNHPLHKKQFRLDELFNYPRVALRMADMERFMLFQRQSGQTSIDTLWPYACETDNLIAALAIISKTDFILPAAGMLAGMASRELNFKQLTTAAAPPFNIAYCLVSHQRVQKSAAHNWLRETITTLIQTLK